MQLLHILVVVAYHLTPAIALSTPSKRPTGFMGVPWRTTKTDAIRILRLSESTDCTLTDSIDACTAPLMLATVSAEAHFFFQEGRLGDVTVTFSAADFDFVKSTFIERYGRPSKTHRSSVRGEEMLFWEWKGVHLFVDQFNPTMEQGEAIFTTDWAIARFEKSESARRRSAVGALDGRPSRGTQGPPAEINPLVDEHLLHELGLAPNMKTDAVVDKLGSPDDIQQSWIGANAIETWIYNERHIELYFSKPDLTLFSAWRRPH